MTSIVRQSGSDAEQHIFRRLATSASDVKLEESTSLRG